MNAELITIGDEILIGQIIDTNSSWIAQRLIELGIDIHQVRSISDNAEHIKKALNSTEADLIILTGGLGPTNDDLTKNTLVEYFETELVFHEAVFKHVNQLLLERGVVVNGLNKEQALLPKDALILENKKGTASGMWFEKSERIVISLPGVPFEMKSIMELEVLPRLKKLNDTAIVHKTIMTQGLPESMLAARIEDWENALPDPLNLSYLPRPGIVRLRLTAKGSDEGFLSKSIDEEIKKLITIIPDHVFAIQDIPLENVLGQLLREKKATVSTAESCTGGQISALITSIEGSSEYYVGSIISYSNEIKRDYLGVSESILEKEGAVSKAAVEKMAISVREKFKTNYSISVSGIAGPGGATEGKPVGYTWIAVASEDKVVSRCYNLGEHRGRNVSKASLSALNLLRLLIMNKI